MHEEEKRKEKSISLSMGYKDRSTIRFLFHILVSAVENGREEEK